MKDVCEELDGNLKIEGLCRAELVLRRGSWLWCGGSLERGALTLLGGSHGGRRVREVICLDTQEK